MKLTNVAFLLVVFLLFSFSFNVYASATITINSPAEDSKILYTEPITLNWSVTNTTPITSCEVYINNELYFNYELYFNSTRYYDFINDSDTIALFNMNEGTGTTLTDSSGNGKHGTMYNMGWNSEGIQFSGTPWSYINLTAEDYWSPTNITIEAWIKLNSTNTTQHIYDQQESNKALTLKITNDGQLAMNVYYYGAGGDIPSGETLNAGQWYYVAGTYDDANNKIMLYINGVNVANGTMNEGIPDMTSMVQIGRDTDLNGYSTAPPWLTFNGTMSAIRVSDVVRTDFMFPLNCYSDNKMTILKNSDNTKKLGANNILVKVITEDLIGSSALANLTISNNNDDFTLFREGNESYSNYQVFDIDYAYVGKDEIGIFSSRKVLVSYNLSNVWGKHIINANLKIYYYGFDIDFENETHVYVYSNYTWNYSAIANCLTTEQAENCWNKTVSSNGILLANWTSVTSGGSVDYYSGAYNVTDNLNGAISILDELYTLLFTSQFENNPADTNTRRLVTIGDKHSTPNIIEYTYSTPENVTYSSQVNYTQYTKFEMRAKNNETSADIENFTVSFINSTDIKTLIASGKVLEFYLENITYGQTTMTIYAFAFSVQNESFYFNETVFFNAIYNLTPAGFYLTIRDEINNALLNSSVIITNITSSLTITNITSISKAWYDIPNGAITIKVFRGMEDFYDRYYYDSMDAYTRINLTAYLLNLSSGQLVSFTVYGIDAIGQTTPLSNALIYVYKQISGVWTLVAQQKTDSSGTAGIFLSPTTYYKIVASASGYSDLINYITPIKTSYDILLSKATALNLTFINIFKNIFYSITPTTIYQNTSQITFSIIDYNSTLQLYGLHILVNNTVLFSQEITGDSNGGNIIATVNLENYTDYGINITAWFKSGTENTYYLYRNQIIISSGLIGTGVSSILTDVVQKIPLPARVFIAIIIVFMIVMSIGQVSAGGSGIISIIALGFLTVIGWFKDLPHFTEMFILLFLTIIAILYLKSRW